MSSYHNNSFYNAYKDMVCVIEIENESVEGWKVKVMGGLEIVGLAYAKLNKWVSDGSICQDFAILTTMISFH